MGLQIDLDFTGNTGTTGMTTTAGALRTTSVIRVRKIEQEDESRLDLRLRMWLSEADFDAGKRDVWVKEIPTELQNVYSNYTPAQFANADNQNIQNNVRKMLEQGDSNALFQSLFPSLIWTGLGDDTVTVVMP